MPGYVSQVSLPKYPTHDYIVIWSLQNEMLTFQTRPWWFDDAMASHACPVVLPPPSLYHTSSEVGKCTISGKSNSFDTLQRFELICVQALGLALLGVALSIQAYVSTGLKPEEVLVWMPLTLVLDAGAMEQLIVLILEKHDERRPWVPRRKGNLPVRRGGRVLWDAVVKAWRMMRQKMARNLLPGHRAERIPAEDGRSTWFSRHHALLDSLY